MFQKLCSAMVLFCITGLSAADITIIATLRLLSENTTDSLTCVVFKDKTQEIKVHINNTIVESNGEIIKAIQRVF